jgi:hypothetical protein
MDEAKPELSDERIAAICAAARATWDPDKWNNVDAPS